MELTSPDLSQAPVKNPPLTHPDLSQAPVQPINLPETIEERFSRQTQDFIDRPERYGQYWNEGEGRFRPLPTPGRWVDAAFEAPKTDEDVYSHAFGSAWQSLKRVVSGHDGELTDQERAKAANIMAISDLFQMPPAFVHDNYEQINKAIGLQEQPPAHEFIPQAAMIGAGAMSLGTVPLWKMALGIAGFVVEEKSNQLIRSYIENKPFSQVKPYGLYDLAPDDASDVTKTVLNLLDLAAKGKAVHVGFNGLGKAWDAFARDNISQVLPTQRFFIPAEAVRKWAGAGVEGGEGEFADILGDLKKRDVLTNEHIRDAARYGLDVEVDPQKIVGMTDSPAWAKVKGVLRLSPYEELKTEPAQVKAKAASPQLEAPKEAKETPKAEKGTSKEPAGYKPPEGRTIDQETALVTRSMWQVEATGQDLAPRANVGAYGGRYQYTTGTWNLYSREWNRVVNKVDEVPQMSGENQDAVTRFKVKEWLEQGYSPKQIASMWNSGHPDWEGRKGHNALTGEDYDVEHHVEKFGKAYAKLSGQPIPEGPTRDAIHGAIRENPHITGDTKSEMLQAMDERAVAWAERTGKLPEEWYSRYMGDMDVPMVGDETAALLRTSVISDGKQYIGEPGERHIELLFRNDLPTGGRSGFATPDGQFLTRAEARDWMEKHQPDVADKFFQIYGEEELHARSYAAAVRNAITEGKEIAKNGSPTKTELRVPATKAAFNKIIKRLGGKALTRKDVPSRSLYKKKLKPKQLDAYHRAYALWNEHGGDVEAIGAVLDREGEAGPSFFDILKSERGAIGEGKKEKLDRKIKELKAAGKTELAAKVERMVEDASRRSSNPIYETNREMDRAAFSPQEGEDPYSPVQSQAARRAAAIIKDTEASKLARFERDLRRQAEQFYQEDPVYRMVRELTKGEGISKASMSDWDQGTITELTRRFPGLIRNEGGFPIDEVAADYGYQSADDLVEVLKELPTKAAYIEGHVTEGIRRWGAELELTEVERQQVFVDEELKVMREAAGAEVSAAQYAATEGSTVWNANTARGLDKIIDRQTGVKVSDIEVATDYDNLKAGIKMAARSSAQAFRAGKIEEAIAQKLRQKELLGKLRLNAETKKALGRIIGAVKKAMESKTVPWEWKQYIVQALQPYSSVLGRIPKMYQAPEVPLRQFLENKTEFNPLIMRAMDQFQAIQGKAFKDFTMGDLKVLYSFVKGMEHAAKTENKFLGKMKTQDFTQAIVEINRQIMATSPRVLGPPLKSGLIEVPPERWTEKAFHQPRGWIADCIRPDVMFRVLQGGKMFAALYDYMEHPFYEARMNKINLDKADSTELSRIIKSLGSLKGWKKTFDIPGIKARFSKMQIFKIALNCGNEGNMNAVLSGLSTLTGRKVTEAHLQMITGQLTKEEWQAVQDIWKLVDKYELLNEVYKEQTGQPMSRVEKRPFATPYGMVAGGYYPLIADPRLSEAAAGRKWEEDIKLMFESPYQSARTKDGFTIERKGMRDLPFLDGLSDLTGHLQDTNHYVSYALPIRDVIKIVRNPGFRDVFTARLGREKYDQLLPWLIGIARRGQRADTAIERSCDRFRRNATVANLGIGLWTGIKHVTMPFFTAHEVGFVPTLRGLGKFLSSPDEMGKFIDERDPMMEATRKRWDREIAAVRDQFDNPFKSKLNGMLADTAFLFIHMVVNTARRAAWLSAFDHGLAKFEGDEGKAIEFSSKVVERMSGSFYPQQMPTVMRKTGLFRLVFTMFHTLGSNKFNRFWEAYRLGMDAKDKGSYRWFAEQVRGLWWLLLAPPVTLAIIRDMIGPERQHALKGEAGPFFGDVISEVVTSTAEALPFLRDVASYAVRKVEAGRATPPTMTLEQMTRLLGDVIARPFAQGPVKPEKDIELLLDALGYGTGFPALNTLRLYRGIMDLESGKSENPASLFMRPPGKPYTWYRPGPVRVNLR